MGVPAVSERSPSIPLYAHDLKEARCARARKLQESVRLIVGRENLEGIVDEEVLETIIVGGGIYTRESLAEVDVEELHARLSNALDEGCIKLPDGYNLTVNRIEGWARSARG